MKKRPTPWRPALAGLLLALLVGASGFQPEGLDIPTDSSDADAPSEGEGSGESQDPLAAFTAHLDERIPALMEAHRVPGVSVALVHQGERVWSRAYGQADPSQRRPMTLDAVYRTEAISKSVTAWGVMKLVQEGRIVLDEPVVRYLPAWTFPESPFPAEEVTVRRLLSHTAGLPSGTLGPGYPPDGEIPTLRDEVAAEAWLVRPPGGEFLYSNVGYHLLELLIEEVTGRDFARYMEEEVLAPLGMRHSGFAWSPAFGPAMPVGHDLRGSPVPPHVDPGKAAGGLFATVEDVARFVAAGMTDAYYRDLSVLDAESLWEMYTPMWERSGVYEVVADGYGFGHLVEYLFDGRQAVFHGGRGYGWTTHFHSVPEAGAGIVILTNSQRSWPLIAEVLTDWAEWGGFGPVGMGRIALAVTALWVLLGIVALALVWQVIRVAWGLLAGTRRFAPLAGGARVRGSIKLTLVIVLAGGLWWSATQDQLLVTWVFPEGAGWLWGILLGLAAVLLLSVLFPRRPAALPSDAVAAEEVLEAGDRALNVKPLP